MLFSNGGVSLCPKLFWPQHSTVPSDLSPHECNPPDDICTNVDPAGGWLEFSPQHDTVPSLFSAHANASPPVSCGARVGIGSVGGATLKLCVTASAARKPFPPSCDAEIVHVPGASRLSAV